MSISCVSRSHRFAAGVLDGSAFVRDHASIAKKLKAICLDVLHQCASTGMIPLSFWKWVRSVGKVWRPDTEYNEGLNSKIKLIVVLAPRIVLPLVSARLDLYVELDGAVGASASKGSRCHAIKWSDVNDNFFSLCDDLVSAFVPNINCSESLCPVDYSDRIVDPHLAAAVVPHGAVPSASASAQALVNWAVDLAPGAKRKLASLNVQWLRAWQKLVEEKLYLPSHLVFGLCSDFSAGWRVVDTVGYVGYLCPCRDTGSQYHCDPPIAFTTSLDIIKTHVFDQADAGVQLWYAEPQSCDGQTYSSHEVIAWVELKSKPKAKTRARRASAKRAPATEGVDGDGEEGAAEADVDAALVFFHAEAAADADADFGLDPDMLDVLEMKDLKAAAAAVAVPSVSKEDFPVVADPTEAALGKQFHARVSPSSPGLPPDESVELDVAQGKKLFESWRASVLCSRTAFELRNAQVERPLGENGEMAFVQYSEHGNDTVAFINFSKSCPSPSLSKAQTVRIDNHNRIVWSSVHYRPWRDLRTLNVSVLVPAVCASMVFAKGWLRDTLLDEMVRLHQMFEQALAGGFVLVPGTRCDVCGINDINTRRCPVCMLSVHACCMMRVVHHTHAQVESPFVAFGSCMPRSFTVPGLICQMCSHFISG